MSDTYRPNEIVKRKHFTEFLDTLDIKLAALAGNTGTRNPTIKELANSQTYDGSLLRIPFSKLTNNNANNIYQYQLEVPTALALWVQPSVILKCEVINITPAGSLIRVQNYTWHGSLNFVNKWVILIGHSKDIPLANYPLTYTLKLSISEGDGFQAYSQDINVEIYNDTE